MRKVLLKFALFLISFNSQASWLCKEASSYQQDNTFYACGHAVESSLSEARESSLRAAKREFDFFCDQSHFCRGKAYNIKPMRTDCSKDEKGFSCYRGLEFIILNEERVIYAHKDELKARVRNLEKRVDSFYSELDSKSKNSFSVEEYKYADLDNAEVELTDLRNNDRIKVKYVAKPSAFSLVLGQTGVYFKGEDQPLDQNKFLTTLGSEYNQRVWNGISFRSQLLIHTSFDSDEEKIKKTYNKDIYHSHSALELNVGFSFLTNYGFIIPNAGVISSSYKFTRNDINQFGAVTTREEEYKQSSTYGSIGWRYGEKYFIEVAPRYYFKHKELSGSVSIGLNFGY